jgi:hypothetical protein
MASKTASLVLEALPYLQLAISVEILASVAARYWGR